MENIEVKDMAEVVEGIENAVEAGKNNNVVAIIAAGTIAVAGLAFAGRAIYKKFKKPVVVVEETVTDVEVVDEFEDEDL